MCMVVLGLCSPESTFGWLPRAGGGLRLKDSFSVAHFLAFLWRLGFTSCSWHPNLTDVIPPTGGSSLGTHQGWWSKADGWEENKNGTSIWWYFSKYSPSSQQFEEASGRQHDWGDYHNSFWESSMARGLSQCLYINTQPGSKQEELAVHAVVDLWPHWDYRDMVA